MFNHNENFEIFYFRKKNGSEIKKSLKANENKNINIMNIDKNLNLFRKCFAHYIKDCYKFKKLGKTNGGSNIAMDES